MTTTMNVSSQVLCEYEAGVGAKAFAGGGLPGPGKVAGGRFAVDIVVISGERTRMTRVLFHIIIPVG
jgi:hypothetical protein